MNPSVRVLHSCSGLGRSLLSQHLRYLRPEQVWPGEPPTPASPFPFLWSLDTINLLPNSMALCLLTFHISRIIDYPSCSGELL